MELFYRVLGSGPPLVILHGLYGLSDNWLSIAKAISSSFTVYLPDLRNHGQSPHSQIHDYDSLSNDIHELVVKLNLKSFHLAGHSMGGRAAISYATKWPQSLNSLTIIDISPFASHDNSNFIALNSSLLQSIGSINLSSITRREVVEEILKVRIEDPSIRALIQKDLKRLPDNSFRWKINVDALARNLTNIASSAVSKESMTKPITGFSVTFLKGDRSDYITPEDVDSIKALFPDASIQEVRDSGHWINVDNPQAVRDALLKNLS